MAPKISSPIGHRVISRLALLIWLSLLVFWMVRDTLALPYLWDDFGHAQLVAEIRAGLQPFWSLIAVPFHGQTVVLLRLLFWLGTLAGGMDPTWVRAGVAVAHVAGALGCAILCERWTGSVLAGWIGGTVYAGAAGFANELLWWPSSGIFCLGAAFLIFAMVFLDPGARNPKVALSLSVLMIVLGALGLNAVPVAALGLPIYCCLVMPSTPFWRRRAPMVCFAVILCLLAALAWQQAVQGGLPHIQTPVRGLWLGAWVIGTAPLRFFSAWTTLPIPGFLTICALAPLAWLPLLASIRLLDLHYRRVLMAVWTPAVVIAFLIGVARVDYPGYHYGPGVLYIGDRYYYFFLFPLATHIALVLSVGSKYVAKARMPVRLAAYASLTICIAAALLASRTRYLANVPESQFEAASHALRQGMQLVEVIREYAAKQSDGILRLTDGPIPADGAWNNRVTLAFLVYTRFPNGLTGVRIVNGPLPDSEEVIQNSILDRWAAVANLASHPACVVGGRLQPVRSSSSIDFHNASYEEDLIDGFSYWEGNLRWIGGRASLRLTPAPGDLVVSAYAPLDLLQKKWPDLRAVNVSAAIDGSPIGRFAIDSPGVHEYRLQHSAVAIRHDAKAEITLTTDFVWHARDLMPQSLDERDLSIALTAIGFGDPTTDRTLCSLRK
jgi:hypothetical protein